MNSQSDERFRSTLAFVDLLFNLLVGIIVLFIIAFLMINPIAKKNDIKSQAHYLIVLRWHDQSASDIDLWVKLPSGCSVGFNNKECGIVHLDRDDLGQLNDVASFDNGQQIKISRNTETVSIRGQLPGRILVSTHFYRRSDSTDPPPASLAVTVTLIRVTPYTEVYSVTHAMARAGDSAHFPSFEIDSDGSVVNLRPSTTSAVPTLNVRYNN